MGSSVALRVRGTGQMAELIRLHPWADTPLGAISTWSPELLVSVNTMLTSRLICCLIWGSARILLYNDLYVPLIGNKPLPLGRPFLDVWDEIRDQADHLISEPLNTGQANLYEQLPFWILIDGQRVQRICSLTNNPVWTETPAGPQIAGIFQTIIDHTQGVLAERELRASEARLQRSYSELQAIYDGGAVASALIDSKTFRYLRVNRRLAELLNQDVQDILGSSVFDVAAGVPGLRAQLEQVAAGASLYNVPLDGELSNDPGEHRYWQSTFVPVRNEDGEISGIAAASIEVTQQKKTNAALIQSEKLAVVGRLAASIAHEINNPLEAVTNLLYLASHSQDLVENKAYLEIAERELRRVSAIANQTLRYYKQSTDAQAVSCEDLFENVLSIHHGRILNQSIQVERRLRATQPVKCFDGEIRQVLTNLIGNAIDALSTSGRRLVIRSRDAYDWTSRERGLVLTVADDGCGMPISVQKRVFEPFFTTKGLSGTGLGLWLSKEIVDRHNGTLRLRSSDDPAAHGTVFSLFLPFKAAQR